MRKIIQIAINGEGNIIALCGDGTLWEQAKGIADSMKWNYIPTAQVTMSENSIYNLETESIVRSEYYNKSFDVPKDMDIGAEYAKGVVDKLKSKMDDSSKSLLNRLEK